MWDISFTDKNKTKFEQLVNYVKDAIDKGDLKEGDPLPTQRELSKKLNLSIGTITKAFNELDKLGYLSGETGRGTFVKDIFSEYEYFKFNEEKLSTEFNLGHFRTTELFNHESQKALTNSIQEVANDRALFSRLDDIYNSGTDLHKEASLTWLNQIGLEKATITNILLCSSATHAISLAIECLTHEGDFIGLEQIGNVVYKDQILYFHRQFAPILLDEEGIIPQSLEEAILKKKIKILITNPTIQNPTTYTSGKKRKEEIASIVEKHNIVVVEVGVLDHFLNKKNTTYFDLIPDNSIYINSLSKTINPAIRVGTIVCNQKYYTQLDKALKVSFWTNSKLLNDIALHLIESGNAKTIVKSKIKLAQQRQRDFKELFNGYEYQAHSNGFHVWFRLPPPWKSAEITQVAYNNGILIRNSEMFYFDQEGLPPYVRITLGAITDQKAFREALHKLKEIIDNYTQFSLQP